MGRRAAVSAVVARLARPGGGVSPLALALLVLAAGGIGWALVRPAATPPTASGGGATGPRRRPTPRPSAPSRSWATRSGT